MSKTIHCGTRADTLTIENGSTTSNDITIAEFAFGSIQIPTTTGAITVQVSVDGTNWSNLTDNNGTAKGTYASNAGARVLFNETFHFERMRLVSAASEAAPRSFAVFLKR